MQYETYFLISLLITLAVEVPVAVILVKYFFKEKISILRIVGISILSTALTIPYLWFIFNTYFDFWTMAICGEIFVFVVESILYWRLLPTNLNKALFISFMANVASIAVGLIIKI
ncbi:MAG: hypothetical protein LBQ24_01345 [Candidatus Peribacteria bacterium]|jgi:hypothetical protein|nr:hypothetical protein [Candidatus Peribacteria bacterium]